MHFLIGACIFCCLKKYALLLNHSNAEADISFGQYGF